MYCDDCMNAVYDDEYEEYVCDLRLDEDEYLRLMESKSKVCPYYRPGDEYSIVRKQN